MITIKIRKMDWYWYCFYTEPALAEAIGMSYDPSKTSIPTMFLAAILI